MCCTRSGVSNTQATTPLRVFSNAESNIASRSAQSWRACSRNASSSITRSFKAQVSSARPKVEKFPCSFAKYGA